MATYRISSQGVGSWDDWQALIALLAKWGHVHSLSYQERTSGAWLGHAGEMIIQTEGEVAGDGPTVEGLMAQEVEAWLGVPARTIAPVGKAAEEGILWIRIDRIPAPASHDSGVEVLRLDRLRDGRVSIWHHPRKDPNWKQHSEVYPHLAWVFKAYGKEEVGGEHDPGPAATGAASEL
jgi:hypothetical protein